MYCVKWFLSISSRQSYSWLTVWSDVEIFVVVPDTLGVVPLYECGPGCGVADQLAPVIIGPGGVPVDLDLSAIFEWLHPATAELPPHLHPQVLGELLVVIYPVQRLLGFPPLSALDASIDDAGGQTKPGLEFSQLLVLSARQPVLLYHRQHGGLGWLRGGEEPEGGGEVEPAVLVVRQVNSRFTTSHKDTAKGKRTLPSDVSLLYGSGRIHCSRPYAMKTQTNARKAPT